MTTGNLLVESGGRLLLADLILLWSLANYAVQPDPVREMRRSLADQQQIPRFWHIVLGLRCVVLAILTLAIAGACRGSLILSLLLFLGSLLLPIARRWWVAASCGAELEVGANVAIVILIVVCIAHWRLSLQHSWVVLPLSDTKQIALMLIAAIVVFNVRGATYIVRGILNKCGALPELAPADEGENNASDVLVTDRAPKPIDTVEFNRGRWIGNLERILLLAIIADASYSAIAFLMAAKSLIRSKDLENREWAEYFLLGTLASATVALAGGFAIRKIVGAFW